MSGDWIDAALEVAKLENPRSWKPQDGDYLGGVVIARRTYRHARSNEDREYLDVQVERGQSEGATVEAGTVYRVNCHVRDLRTWLERENPARHDRVVLLFEGADGPHPNSRKRYVAKVVTE